MEKRSNINRLFDGHGNLTSRAMRDYLEGRLSKEEITAFEEHIAGSDFDREALEGMKLAGIPAYDRGMEEVRQRMQEAISEKKYPRGRRVYMTMYSVGMAASVILLAGIVYLLSTLRTGDESRLASAEEKEAKVEAAVAPDEEVVEDLLPEPDAMAEVAVIQEADEDVQVQQPEPTKAVAAAKPKENYQLVMPVEDAVADEQEPLRTIAGVTVESPIGEGEEAEVVVTEFEAIEAVHPEQEEVAASAPEPEVKALEENLMKESYVLSGAGTDNRKRSGGAKSARQEMALQELNEVVTTGDEVFVVVEEMPEFPGGKEAMMEYFEKKMKYPDEALENNVEGKVFLSFVVKKDGRIADIRVLRGIGYGCDEEAVRLVDRMPRWSPGKQGGEKVAVQFTLPIEFELK